MRQDNVTPLHVIYAGLGYALLGLFGVLLAIPPGYASPIFPAAGLALTLTLISNYRHLISVWFGSFFLNLYIGWSNAHQVSLFEVCVSVFIACGATLQAGTGAWLIKRVLDVRWKSLLEGHDIVLFLVLGGPLSCFISASIATLTLHLSGLLTLRETPWSLWCWYSGDVLGVLIFTPITLAFFGIQEHWKARKIIVLPTMLILLTLITLAYFGTAKLQAQKGKTEIDNIGNELAYRVQERIDDYSESLLSLQTYLEVTPDLTNEEFQRYAKHLLAYHPGMTAISFNSVVNHENRKEFEKNTATKSLHGSFQITEKDKSGNLRIASNRDKYVVVTYIAPLEANLSAIGYDIYSDELRKKAIDKAIDTAEPSVTPVIKLVQDKSGPGANAALILYPVYSSLANDNLDKTIFTPVGFAVGILRFDHLLSFIKEHVTEVGVDFELRAYGGGLGGQLIYNTKHDSVPISTQDVWRTRLSLADSIWELSVFPSARWFEDNWPWQSWVLTFLALLVASVLQVLMLTLTGQTLLIKRTVDEQTKDLTENSESLKAALVSAETANKAKSIFLSSMTHELRTPLNAIIGLSQLLEYDSELNEHQKVNIREINKAGEHLVALIDDVLDLARIESGSIQLKMTEVSVLTVLEECMRIITPIAKKTGILVDMERSKSDHICVDADYVKLKQVLLNLLSNAVKYNRTGGQVRVYCDQIENDIVRINIVDTGLGISCENLQDLFKPFNRLGNEFGSIKGTGIGLVISKQLTELMGGGLGVESVVGQGSTFWVQLKAHQYCKLVGNIVEDAGVPKVGEMDASVLLKSRILIAEDNEINQKVLVEQLKLLGLRADLAADGSQAWDYIQGSAYDLLLADIYMPIMDGYELTQKIRQLEQHTGEHLPIIAITANAMNEDVARCLECGMDGFVSKPVKLVELRKIVVKWLSDKHL